MKQRMTSLANNCLYPTLFALALGLSACGNSGGSNNGRGSEDTPTTTIQNPITIDNAGVVPIIGNNATTSIIYVHNNTDQTISDISYTASINTENSQFLDSASAKLCSSIPAHQACPLTFTTPALDKSTAQGSALIVANYSQKSKARKFSQIINFSRISNQTDKGALFNSGVQLLSSGNSTAYGTVYIYGSGENQVYNVSSISVDKPSVKIIQGNISGKQISSNYVSALEVSAPADFANSKSGLEKSTSKSSSLQSDGYLATLTLASASTASGKSYDSTSNMNVAPAASGAILTSGNVPLIDSSTDNPSGTLYITNVGNEPATLTMPSGTPGIYSLSNCGSGGTLASGASCQISFKVQQTGGNGTISMNYTSSTSGTIIQNVIWYNGKGDALLQMSANPNPLSFNLGAPAVSQVTITNIGGYDLSNVSTTQDVPAPTTVASSQLTCVNSSGVSTQNSLPIGGSCTYNITVNSPASTTGNITLKVTGSYSNGSATSYTRQLNVPYTAIDYRAILTISPNPLNMSTTGDGVQSQSRSLTIINSGAAPAIISTSGFVSTPVPSGILVIVLNGCNGKTLATGDACVVELKLGPIYMATNGNTQYRITYSGGSQGMTNADSIINYTVLPYEQNLVLTNVSSDATGDGSSANSYQINGSEPNKVVTLTYTNQGTNPIAIQGINNTNSPISWQIDTTASTCYSSGSLPSTPINVGNSCSLVFKNVLASNIKAVTGGLPASYSENIGVPTIIFSDLVVTGKQFNVTPNAPAPINGATIYATGNQATIANNLVLIKAASNSECVSTAGFDPAISCVKVTHNLTNGTGYGSLNLNVTSQMENYFTSAMPSTLNCTTSPGSGIVTQNCSLDPTGGTASAYVYYPIDSSYSTAILHALFNLTIPQDKVIGFSPLSSTTPLQ